MTTPPLPPHPQSPFVTQHYPTPTDPAQPQSLPQQPTAARKPWQLWALSGAVLLVTLIAGITIGATSTRTSAPTPSASPVATTGSAPPVTRRSVPGAATVPSPPPATSVVIPATTIAAGPAKAITEREWQLIAKNPDPHIGERVIVYGQVTQFDSATGVTGLRANVGAKAKKASYGWADYDTNTVLTGTSDQLADVVQGDLFKAEVTVAGSYSYQTTMGGTLTAPSLSVTKIDVTGHV
jgi:hypothetical protein